MPHDLWGIYVGNRWRGVVVSRPFQHKTLKGWGTEVPDHLGSLIGTAKAVPFSKRDLSNRF
jgi:hypothetical protein